MGYGYVEISKEEEVDSGLEAAPLAVGAQAADAAMVYENHLKPCGGALEDRQSLIKLDYSSVDKVECRCTYTTKNRTAQ